MPVRPDGPDPGALWRGARARAPDAPAGSPRMRLLQRAYRWRRDGSQPVVAGAPAPLRH